MKKIEREKDLEKGLKIRWLQLPFFWIWGRKRREMKKGGTMLELEGRDDLNGAKDNGGRFEVRDLLSAATAFEISSVFSVSASFFSSSWLCTSFNSVNLEAAEVSREI